MIARATWPLALGFALALLCAACGYSVGGELPQSVRALSVPIAVNDTLYRGAEVTYTRELQRELVRRTNVRLVGERHATARLETRILDAPRFPLVEDRRDRILEDAILVRVAVRLYDHRTGQDLVPPFEVARRAERITARGEEIADAIDEALRDVARETVIRIEADSFVRAR